MRSEGAELARRRSFIDRIDPQVSEAVLCRRLLGRYGSDLTRVYLKVSGDSKKPEVAVPVAKLLASDIHALLAQPMGAIVHHDVIGDCRRGEGAE